MVANLRAENAMLRGKYQSILAEQNDVLDDKHTQHVNHLMNVKYDIEEQVEAELERFDQLKRQLRAFTVKVKNLTLADKSNLYDEREHERTRLKHEDKVEMWMLKHSEEVSLGKKLRVIVDDLRHDKMNIKKLIQEKSVELEARSAEAVQLINIANQFYTQRQKYRLVASELIAEAGQEAEEHRSKMQEITNRIDYFDLVMQEREEEYQKMLLDAERQAANLNDPSEEMKEAQKRRQQELVEAFDKLMYASGVWDVDELVTRFLFKEEKMSLAKNYLDALTEDAEKIEKEIKQYCDEASSMLTAKPEEDAEVVLLQENISAIEAKSSGLRQQTEHSFAVLEELGHVLGLIKKRMAACPALDMMRPVKRRWALLRANLARVPLIAQRPRVDANKGQPGLSKAPPAKFDPRRKTLLEELKGDAEAGSNGVEALTDIALIEHHSLVLLAKAEAQRVLQHPRVLALTKPIEKPPESDDAAKLPQAGKDSGDDASEHVEGAQDNSRLRRRRRGASPAASEPRQSPPRSAASGNSRTRDVRGRDKNTDRDREKDKAQIEIPPDSSGKEESDKADLSLFPGPLCEVADAKKGRAVLHVVPSLKEIDTPRDLEALSSQEIRQQVAEGGHSERVLDRIRRVQAGQNRVSKGH
jgi:hypothetical protein